MFEFVRCSKNDVRVRSMFDKMVFDTSLIKPFLAKNRVGTKSDSEWLKNMIEKLSVQKPARMFLKLNSIKLKCHMLV